MPGSQSVRETAKSTPRPSPRATARIVTLLRLLADHKGGASLRTLCELTSTPKTSLLTLLRALVESGYLTHADGRYTLGTESFKLGAAIVANRTFPNIAQQPIESLAEKAGETVLISELTEDMSAIAYIAKAESQSAIRLIAAIGDRRPLAYSSGGRVLLAHQSKEIQELALKGDLPAPPPGQQRLTKASLKALLKQIRDDGMDTHDLGTSSDVAGVAAPIFDGSGRAIASLTIGGPTARMVSSHAELTNLLLSTAHEISQLLGYRPA